MFNAEAFFFSSFIPTHCHNLNPVDMNVRKIARRRWVREICYFVNKSQTNKYEIPESYPTPVDDEPDEQQQKVMCQVVSSGNHTCQMALWALILFVQYFVLRFSARNYPFIGI